MRILISSTPIIKQLNSCKHTLLYNWYSAISLGLENNIPKGGHNANKLSMKEWKVNPHTLMGVLILSECLLTAKHFHVLAHWVSQPNHRIMGHYITNLQRHFLKQLLTMIDFWLL